MTNVGNLLYNATAGNTNTGLTDSAGNPADSPLDLPHSDVSWQPDINPGQTESDVIEYCVSVLAKAAQMNVGLDENATDIGVWLIGSQRKPMNI
jgi:hypothetical protein